MPNSFGNAYLVMENVDMVMAKTQEAISWRHEGVFEDANGSKIQTHASI
jgi:hypothetical protein